MHAQAPKPNRAAEAEASRTVSSAAPSDDTGAIASIRAIAPNPERPALHVLSVTNAAGRCTVSVELRKGDDQAIAVAEGLFASAIVRRLVAEATLQALALLEPAVGQLGVDAVSVAPVGGQAVVTVTVIQLLGQHEEVLAGSAVVRPAGEHDAVARAVLSATVPA